ncbi:MAG: outer membrane lipoprotein-sorting protein [Verrucomicrobiales bacterium]|jgi:outer membrane lipoprotein-sorting protein
MASVPAAQRPLLLTLRRLLTSINSEMRSPLALPLVLTAFLLSSLSTVHGRDIDLTPVRKWIDAQSKMKSLHGTFVQERKMSTIRRTFKKEGSFWYQAPGHVRWEIGQDYLAVKNEKEVLIMEPKKKMMKRHVIDALKEDQRLGGIAFIEAGFPRTLADFQKGFQITKITKDENYYSVETKIRDSKASLALTKLVFYIYEKDHQLMAFQMFFRDKSTIYNRFTRIWPNKAVPAGTFTPNTEGYKVVK